MGLCLETNPRRTLHHSNTCRSISCTIFIASSIFISFFFSTDNSVFFALVVALIVTFIFTTASVIDINIDININIDNNINTNITASQSVDRHVIISTVNTVFFTVSPAGFFRRFSRSHLRFLIGVDDRCATIATLTNGGKTFVLE